MPKNANPGAGNAGAAKKSGISWKPSNSPHAQPTQGRPTFTLVLRPLPGADDSIHTIRALRCHAHYAQFNNKEYQFILSMLSWRGEPSERQLKWLIDLFVRTGGARS
jgi:hypothetical protein